METDLMGAAAVQPWAAAKWCPEQAAEAAAAVAPAVAPATSSTASDAHALYDVAAIAVPCNLIFKGRLL